MSVYTTVPVEDLQNFLHHYNAGQLHSLQGIRDGIENTNYFVTTDSGEYVLTLFERTEPADVRFGLHLMSTLAQHGLPCARPITNGKGDRLARLCDKPASLVIRLPGESVDQPDIEHCRAVGQTLATLHRFTQALAERHENPRGQRWRQAIATRLRSRLDAEQLALLDDELRFQQQRTGGLPTGIIHGDLFRDNVLFNRGGLSGLIDLYNAGHDLLLYDLAITVNDWCTRPDGQFRGDALQALLQAYTEQRPVTGAEQAGWPMLLRRAALRFWLSRLNHQLFSPPGSLSQTKDSGFYHQLLLNYRRNPPKWPL